MWWTGALPEHYNVSNVELTKHDGAKELQNENIREAIHANKEPRGEEPPVEVSTTTLENLTKSLGGTTPSPSTIASLDFSEWKLVTKKYPGVATVPRESGGHEGTQ